MNGPLGTLGTKTLLWPLVLANAGTLTCLIAGRANPIAAAIGLVAVALGVGLILRYTIVRRRGRDLSDTEVL